MVAEVQIPENNWSDVPMELRHFIPAWEKRLRQSISEQPDPQQRFTEWLSRKADGNSGVPGAGLVFFEQPYLDWAKDIDRLIEFTMDQTRKDIGYELLHYDD